MSARAPVGHFILGVLLLTGLAACPGSTGSVGGPPTNGGDGGGACKPSTCMPGTCGPTSDGCGGMVDCGGCGTFTCGAAMTPGWCGTCSVDGWCAEDPLPEGGDGFEYVTVVSNSSVWASHSWRGSVMEWDGTAWRDRSSKVDVNGTVQGPWDIWGASPTDVWGVSYLGLWHWDGVKWALTEKAGWWPNAIAGSSASDIWVVGNDGLIGHFDGSTWSRVDSPVTAHLLSISVRAPNDVWAAGLGASLLHWDGTSWARVGTDNLLDWSEVTASAEGEVWLLARNGEVYRWRGSFEAMRASRSGYGYLVKALWALSPTNVWLVGENGLAEHWDGTRLVPTETATNAIFKDIAGAPNGDVWVVGQSMDGVAFRRTAR